MRLLLALLSTLVATTSIHAATGDGAISADGNSVTFIATRDGLAQGRVFVYDIAENRLEEVSVSTDGVRADGDSLDRPAISADGQQIAFTSFATNLTDDPNNSTTDVFLRDRSVPETTLPFFALSGSQAPHMSRDALVLSFFSNQAAPEDTTSSIGEAYVFDRSDDSIQVATIDENGVQIGGGGTLNGDGTLYGFEDDDNIYLRDLAAGTTQLLGSFPAFFTFFGDLSADGNFVLFQTTAGLDAADTNGRRDIYLLNVSGGGPELISYDQSGLASNQDSFGSRISDDGRFVAFTSLASDLVSDDTSPFRDVFLRDRQNGAIQRVSISTSGAEGNGDSRIQDISGDGMKVLFSSQATNLDDGAEDCSSTNYCNLYLRDIGAGTTMLIPPPDVVRVEFPLMADAGDAFGAGVAASGNLFAIGAPNDDDAGTDAGAVSIFRLEGGTPILDEKIIVPSGYTATGFGTAVALSGDTLVVGAPATGSQVKGGGLTPLQGAIFERTQTGWTFKQPLSGQNGGSNDEFGAAVSIDGDQIVVGAPGDSQAGTGSGAAFAFDLDGDQFVLTQKLMPGSAVAGQRFGSAVSVKGDLLAVGSPQGQVGAALTGSATVFQRIAGNLQELATSNGSTSAENDEFGSAVAIDGTRVIIGAPGVDGFRTNQGEVYVFDVGGGNLVEVGRVQAGTPQDNARFGAAVAASDGAFAVGAPEEGDGAAYRFTGELAQRSRLVPRAGETGYGLAVALSGDRFVVGAADTNNQAGAAVLESDPEKLFQSGYE